jgi:hypothetical protein
MVYVSPARQKDPRIALMLRLTLVASLIAAIATPALAQQPLNLLPPREQLPPADKPLVEESPSFQPMRPVEAEAPAPLSQPMPQPLAQPEPAPAAQPAPAPVQAVPVQAAPAPVAEPAAMPAPVMVEPVLPSSLVGVMVLAGAFLAGLFGILTATLMRRGEQKQRRRAVALTVATELETRRLAFESLPLPPNVEAGVSFVSSVTSLAGIDAGFRAVQGNIHLLPEKLAAHVSVHYAAVQRVSDFVKGQSLAAAVRMLQANRMGGQPCPDAGTMREAHVELAVAFRGVDKLAQALKRV